MTLGIFLVLVLANPLTAHSPTIPSRNELYLISGNSLKATATPLSVKFQTLGVKFGDIDLERINTLPSEIYQIIQCESGWNNNAIGKAGEIGLAQFMPTTWKMFNEIRRTNLDIHSAKDQIDMIVWAFENGKQTHWSCWKYVYHY